MFVMVIMMILISFYINVYGDNDDVGDNLSVNGKADNDQKIAEGCHHYANLIIRMMIMMMITMTMIKMMGSTAMETAMSTVRNMPKGAGQQEGPQS